MKNTLISIATIALLSFGTTANAATYKNCAAVNKEFKGGVALSVDSKNTKKSKGVIVDAKSKYPAVVDEAIYNQIKKLDKDKDGIACEK